MKDIYKKNIVDIFINNKINIILNKSYFFVGAIEK